MEINKRILFSVVLVLIISLTFGYSNNGSSVPKENIEEFLNKKSELYEEQKALVDSFYEQYKEVKVDEILKDIKKLLTEKEYERLISKRYIIDEDLIKENYDKSEIKDIEYEKVSENEEKVIYAVKYTEKLYCKKELKLEKIHENEFTLEKIDNNWLISYI